LKELANGLPDFPQIQNMGNAKDLELFNKGGPSVFCLNYESKNAKLGEVVVG
jgi:hypothetical protein